MGEGSGTKRGRRRSRRRRRSRSRSRRGGNNAKKHDNRGNQKSNRRRKRRGSDNGIRAADNNTPCLGAQRYFTGKLNAFELFCAYHLGIGRDGSVRKHSLNDVARRFNTDRAGLDSALAEFNMARDHVRKSGFDLEMAKLDVTVVPPGVDRVEVARTLYTDFLAAGCGVGPLPEAQSQPD